MANQAKEQWSEEFFATPTGVALYPALAEPKAWEGQEPKYEITLVFDASKKDALKKLQIEQIKAAKKFFGDKAIKKSPSLKQGSFDVAIEGSEQDVIEVYQLDDSIKQCLKVKIADDGTKYLIGKFRTKNKPKVVMFDRSDCGGDSIVSGDLVRVSFKFASGMYAGNKYVKGVLFGVQKIGTGGEIPEGFGRSAPKIEDMFDEVEPIGLASINSEEW